jgi:hypothetical protein
VGLEGGLAGKAEEDAVLEQRAIVGDEIQMPGSAPSI